MDSTAPLDVTGRVDSVARTLDVVGDRWAFLILREAFFGMRRFEGFRSSLGIARNILTDRLKRLTEAQVLERRPYQDNPPRSEYRLTERGRDLYPITLALMNWGDRWLATEDGPPLVLRHKRHLLRATMRCERCGEEVDPRDVTYAPGPGADL